MKNSKWFCFIYIILSLTAGPGFASDQGREQRLTEQTLAALFIGEPVFFSIQDREILGLETPAVDETKGAVILLHGRGLGADSQIVVGPLRESLADSGWHTLSLQMPVLQKGAKYYDYVEIFAEAHPRIEAGIKYLQEQEISPIILLAHSCSVHMSMDWINSANKLSIDGFIGLAMGATDYRQPMKQPFPFAKMKIPILDVYGSDDYPAVVDKALQRFEAFSHSHKDSQQVVIEQADHEFTDQSDQLFKTVSVWLESADFSAAAKN